MSEFVDFEGKAYAEGMSKEKYPIHVGTREYLLTSNECIKKMQALNPGKDGQDVTWYLQEGCLDILSDAVRAALDDDDKDEFGPDADLRVIFDAFVQIKAAEESYASDIASIEKYLPKA